MQNCPNCKAIDVVQHGQGGDRTHQNTPHYECTTCGHRFVQIVPSTQSSPWRWFYNLPIRTKQIIGLFTSEFISVIGLTGIGAILIISAGRTQLLRQAIAELTVNDIHYNIKVNQMGFGFRGQADNAAIVAAATYSNSQDIDPKLTSQIKQILQNEIQARTIEYATLVGTDRRILVSANADRQGEIFDPNGLVSRALETAVQIKASEIISWDEFSRETPPLPTGLEPGQDLLIRYVVTPVKANGGEDKGTTDDNIVGVLVSGDVVNGKQEIPFNTVTAFDGGYSAVYQLSNDNTFSLSTVFLSPDHDFENWLPAVSIDSITHNHDHMQLSDFSLLEQAVNANGTPVSGRQVIGGVTYTLAASAVSNSSGSSSAVIVRGTPETALNTLLRNSLMVQLAVAVLAFIVDAGLARFLGRALVDPIQQLRSATQRFSQGDRTVRANVFASDEVGVLSQTFNEMADSITQQEAAMIRTTRLKDEFLANMSHELRTPLNAILGTAEGLQENVFGTINEPQLKAIQTIENSGLHLLELINDILDVAKIESGQMGLECQPTAVAPLCQSSLEFITPQASKKRIQVKMNLPPNLPQLMVDERRIRQVLINLLTNAVKFTPDEGQIILNVGYEESENSHLFSGPSRQEADVKGFLRIAVIDTGIGISADHITQLFQPFVQIDSTLNRNYDGAGLGLAIVKRIVDLHGGYVSVTSERGVGSCFAVDLPCVASSLSASESDASSESATNVNPSGQIPSSSILLVENNEATISTISNYLGARGHRLILANTGQEAIALAQSEAPNVILMDIQLLGMDGLNLIERMRNDSRLVDTPIIVIVTLAMHGDREHYLNAGATDCVSKPIKLQELSSRIQICLT